MILVIMILSLISGCGNLQNNMHQKDGQVENVFQKEMDVSNDSFPLKMKNYEVSFCCNDLCDLTLSDSVVGCIKGMRSPVLKIEFEDGDKIAKGISFLCSEAPSGCDFFYYYDFDDKRVVLSGKSEDCLRLVKINERSRKELEACNNSFALKLQDYEILSSDENSYKLKLSDSVVSHLEKMRSPVLKIEFKNGTKIAKGMYINASEHPYSCDLIYDYLSKERKWWRTLFLRKNKRVWP